MYVSSCTWGAGRECSTMGCIRLKIARIMGLGIWPLYLPFLIESQGDAVFFGKRKLVVMRYSWQTCDVALPAYLLDGSKADTNPLNHRLTPSPTSYKTTNASGAHINKPVHTAAAKINGGRYRTDQAWTCCLRLNRQ